MRCERAQAWMDRYVVEGLSPAERESFEIHLRDCRGCQEQLARIQRLVAALRSVVPPPVPEGFADRVLARTRNQEPIADGGGLGRSKRAVWRQVRAGLGTAAALAAGLLLGLFLGHETWQPVPESPTQISQTDPLAGSGLGFLAGPGDDTLAQTYLQLTSSREG